MITVLAKFEKEDTNYYDVIKTVPVKKGFQASIIMWNKIAISVDTEEIVIGYSEAYKHISEPFVDEEYFHSSSNFVIEEETDPNLSQRIKYYCFDKKGRLVFKKVNHHPGYEIEWEDVVKYSNKRRLKILSFLDEIDENEDDGKEG